MKLGKKLWSILLTMAMVLSMMVPAMAETTDPTTVTIEGTGNEFSAWQLLTATEGNNNNFAYELNPKYKAVFQSVAEKTTSKDIVAYITGLTAEGLRVFADEMYAEIKDAGLAADATTTSNTFNLDQGYYLIAETVKGDNPDTVSKVMLDTKGKNKLTVETKEGTVDFEKKVKETNDTTGAISGWQDGADYDIGDYVPFQLKATLPNDFEDYTTYQLTFHDKQSEGLTFNQETVKVFVDDDPNPIGSANYAVVTEGLTDGCTFEIRFANLRAVTAAENGSVITVEYKSTLNSGAVIGSVGNPNEARVEYTNGSSTDKTVWDKVIVFTYEFDVNKVDNAGNALKGADFTLYKQEGTSLVEVARKSVNNDGTTFTFTGLDAGDYILKETTVPAGYNKADDIEFTITASYETKSNNPQFRELTITGIATRLTEEGDAGKVEANVENLTGTELPSTGGIGTTIFYVAGGILVVGAAVMLFAKKRTENEE